MVEDGRDAAFFATPPRKRYLVEICGRRSPAGYLCYMNRGHDGDHYDGGAEWWGERG